MPSEISKVPVTINKVGLLNVVIEDFNSHTLGRLNTLNTKVNYGGRFNDVDVDFCSYVAALYKDITSKALYNESRINN